MGGPPVSQYVDNEHRMHAFLGRHPEIEIVRPNPNSPIEPKEKM